MKKILGNFTYISSIISGALSFVCAGMPYLYGIFEVGYEKSSYKFNGFEVTAFWDYDGIGRAVSVFQIIVLALSVALLLCGVVGFLNTTGLIGRFAEKPKDKMIKTVSWTLIGSFFVAIFVLLLLLVLFVPNESKDYVSEGVSHYQNFYLRSGHVILVILSSVVYLIGLLFERKYATPLVWEKSRHCSVCGAKIKDGYEYCSQCGVKINEDDEKAV